MITNAGDDAERRAAETAHTDSPVPSHRTPSRHPRATARRARSRGYHPSVRSPQRMAGPKLPCPACGLSGRAASRIGNRRGQGCATCNRFASAVRRETDRELQSRYSEEYVAMKRVVEREEYESLIRTWLLQNPPIEVALAIEAESWPALPESEIARLSSGRWGPLDDSERRA